MIPKSGGEEEEECRSGDRAPGTQVLLLLWRPSTSSRVNSRAQLGHAARPLISIFKGMQFSTACWYGCW